MSRDGALGGNERVWGSGGAAVKMEASPAARAKVGEVLGAGVGEGAGTTSSGTCI